MSELRVAIVDDEPVARRAIRKLLESEDDLTIVGEATTAEEAVELIERENPDVVFLDVQMPGGTGLEAIARLEDPLPLIIFVTAYDEYSLEAFEVDALDYLLKPFTPERVGMAVKRARTRTRETALADAQRRRLELSPDPGVVPERIAVRGSGRVRFVDVEAIEWIEGAGAYARLHTKDRSYLLRESLTKLEGRLDPRRFLRIHRSAIVRIDRIVELRPRSHGDQVVLLTDGSELRVSRTRREEVLRKLGLE